MTNRLYFKTDDPEVLRLLEAHNEQRRAVQAAGNEFARLFGGIALFFNSVHGYEFAGLKFSAPKIEPIWTKPDPKLGGLQRPRATLKGATAAQKSALAELQSRWTPNFPSIKSDYAPVLKAMGTDWGDLLFGGGGIAYFQHAGYVWVTTGAKLAPCMKEVLASEYLAAKAAFDGLKAAA